MDLIAFSLSRWLRRISGLATWELECKRTAFRVSMTKAVFSEAVRCPLMSMVPSVTKCVKKTSVFLTKSPPPSSSKVEPLTVILASSAIVRFAHLSKTLWLLRVGEMVSGGLARSQLPCFAVAGSTRFPTARAICSLSGNALHFRISSRPF